MQEHISKFISNLPNASGSDLEVDGEAVLKAIEAQHGFFVERARGIYSFSHLTFQEYFTAKYYVDNRRDKIMKSFIPNNVADPRWREVCLLIAGLLNQADDFFVAFKRHIDNLIRNTNISNMLGKLAEISTEYSGTTRYRVAVSQFRLVRPLKFKTEESI